VGLKFRIKESEFRSQNVSIPDFDGLFFKHESESINANNPLADKLLNNEFHSDFRILNSEF